MSETLTENLIDFERIPTGIEGTSEEDDIIITARALEMIGAIREDNSVPGDYFLRIGTRGGGCSGMSYTLGFDSEMNEEVDRNFKTEKVNLVVDSKSLFYLMGVTLDFVEGPQGSGFVFHNPNNAHTCGCHG